MRVVATAVCAAAVAAAGGTPASAGLPPSKPLLVNLSTGHLGIAGAGEPAMALTAAWGAADLIAGAKTGSGAVMLWLDGMTAWAAATFDDAGQEHATSLFYRGRFRTARNDHNGTPLKVVLRHWPHHAGPQTSETVPGYTSVTINGTRLLFDHRKRLAAVANGTEAATALANP